MPTSRSSTTSSRPTPCAPARRLSSSMACSTVTGLPSIDTGTPRSNPTITSSGRAPVDGRVLGVVVDVLGRRVPEVLEEAGFHRAAPHVLVDGERRALGDVDRDGVLLGERDGLLPRPRVVADGGQHLQIGCQRGESDLEADLVVALAGAAVGDDAAAVLAGRVHQVLDDQRPAQRRHQRVAVHVERVGLDRRQAVLRRRTRRGRRRRRPRRHRSRGHAGARPPCPRRPGRGRWRPRRPHGRSPCRSS